MKSIFEMLEEQRIATIDEYSRRLKEKYSNALITKFESQQEIWEALILGETIMGPPHGDGCWLYKLVGGELNSTIKNTDLWATSGCSFSLYQMYSIYKKDPEWFENLEESGSVLCWVSDDTSSQRQMCSVVTGYDADENNYPFTTVIGESWRYATPVKIGDVGLTKKELYETV